MTARAPMLAGWVVAIGAAVGVRLWNALAGPLMWGYDAWGHVAYVLFLDLYRALPLADQGWSYYHPPLHYALGWVLAQLGSGELLMRGLSVLGSAASLGIAALAAWVVRTASPRTPALALVAFGSVAFLPVHFFVSPMPGNEMTGASLSAAAVVAFLANQRRRVPTLARDVATGALVGLALLAKFSGLLPLVAIEASLALGGRFGSGGRSERARGLGRGLLIAGVALAIAGPIYLRNVVELGKPFPSNSDYPLVSGIERSQPPGSRTWKDYLTVPAALFANPDPRAPQLLHSVWGSVYLNTWADTHRESDVVRVPGGEAREKRSASWMAAVGLLPTALAVIGAILALCDAVRGRRRDLYLPLLLLSAATLAAFAWFTWRVPTWAALKASYCLALSVPFAVFAARGVEWLTARAAPWLRIALLVWLGVAAASAAVTAASGAVLPRRADAPASGAVRFYFGEYPEARRVYGRLIAGAPYAVPWLENLAAVELADGRPERARALYARAVSLAAPDPYRQGRLAVATALAGDLEAARDLLDGALTGPRLPELLVNRGAIRAALGELAGAERDLREGLESAPDLVPGWLDLAAALEGAGRIEEAGRARARAGHAACRTPRGYPHGVGTGEILEWGVGRRWLLLLGEKGLWVALPDFYRGACRELCGGGAPPP